MAQQRAASLQDAPDRVFLVRSQVTVAQMLANHAGKGQMRAVERTQAQTVEAVVVVAGQPRGAFGVLPHPFAEAVLRLLLFLAGGDCLLLVDDARAVLAFVISGRRATVQGGLDQVGGPEPRGAVRRRVADVPAGCEVNFKGPGRDRLGMGDAHAVRGSSSKCATKSRISVAGIQDEPSRASISPGWRSGGCTASSASMLR
jgi:hypothetical protein